MSYPVLQRGDILCCHDPYSPLADLISLVEGCHWSHVALALSPDRAIQALGRGVTPTPMRKFTWKSGRVKVVRIKPELIMPGGLEVATAFAEHQKGKGYDYLLIPELLWLYVSGQRGTEVLPERRNKYICSELVAQPLWNFAHFRFNDVIPPENTTPADIAESNKVEVVWE